jgi:hypothetical protein
MAAAPPQQVLEPAQVKDRRQRVARRVARSSRRGPLRRHGL